MDRPRSRAAWITAVFPVGTSIETVHLMAAFADRIFQIAVGIGLLTLLIVWRRLPIPMPGFRVSEARFAARSNVRAWISLHLTRAPFYLAFAWGITESGRVDLRPAIVRVLVPGHDCRDARESGRLWVGSSQELTGS